MIRYKEFPERKPDTQYRQLLKKIKEEGERDITQMEEDAFRLIGEIMRFNLIEGFPVITERDLVSGDDKRPSQFQMALGELCAFLNGARTLEEMKKFGCGWWARWVTEKKCGKRGLETGDLGPGSYGAAWRNFPTAEGNPFDQISHLIEQIKELPHLRTHFVSPWIPQYIGRGKGKTQKVVVAPCHGWFHIIINTGTKELTLHHFQRSADIPVGYPFNMIQYAALAMMIGQITGYTPKEVVFTISDAHIYINQLKDVDELLATEAQPLPTVTIDPNVKTIFDFRPEHFKVTDYKPQLPRRTIWTPV